MATFEQIKDIIVEALQCDAEIVQPEAKINEDLGADSLDMVELIMALEESFSIKIADEHTQNINNVQDVAELINRLTADAV